MKKIFDKMFGQYRGLRRELYVLFLGEGSDQYGGYDMAYADVDFEQ